ncbi:hypothetical protein APHWI1_0386 [Anaplasma phagocytophilum str. ApWI1]|uniref:Uncharacterized protein n=1 Tax=Anaplasma phagocytophilum str. ApWI1 TaxID=1359155 RepID=A0A0F3PY50_ANAPH|nr:hypothetical protein APHWEB_1130 [Anaplasma phagocytophilum str. Webster]KJV82703.1 hypothetical protein APHHGE2_1182 [Anaplasma phagocytophilum str. HGE2]KJV85310.1 hypothetical protein APHWI1_0386 [Anaplasma phagocytophilum str. ApWI1]
MLESNDCTTARMIANFCQLNCHNRILHPVVISVHPWQK